MIFSNPAGFAIPNPAELWAYVT